MLGTDKDYESGFLLTLWRGCGFRYGLAILMMRVIGVIDEQDETGGGEAAPEGSS